MRPQREFTNGFETPMPSVSIQTPTFFIERTRITLPMHEQLHAPVQNAASDRFVYPEQPSLALTASIEARRKRLTGGSDEMISRAPTNAAYGETPQMRTSRDEEVSLR